MYAMLSHLRLFYTQAWRRRRVVTPTSSCRINALGILAWSDSEAMRETLECSDVVVTPLYLYASVASPSCRWRINNGFFLAANRTRGVIRSNAATSSSRRCVYTPATCSEAVAMQAYKSAGVATAWRPKRHQLKRREYLYASDSVTTA